MFSAGGGAGKPARLQRLTQGLVCFDHPCTEVAEHPAEVVLLALLRFLGGLGLMTFMGTVLGDAERADERQAVTLQTEERARYLVFGAGLLRAGALVDGNDGRRIAHLLVRDVAQALAAVVAEDGRCLHGAGNLVLAALADLLAGHGLRPSSCRGAAGTLCGRRDNDGP